MLEEIRQKLSEEVQKLNHELAITLPETLKKALAQGDLRENGDYHAALERQQFVHARLSHLRSRLSKLSQIDLSKIPTDRVGLGSRVVVEVVGTKERETYELVIPGRDGLRREPDLRRLATRARPAQQEGGGDGRRGAARRARAS